ncbi:MAG: hypothetical protein RLZZ469_1425 [Bacteroidota bacterium]
MVDFFNFILDFIRVDLLIGFGWYSVLFYILRLFKYKKDILTEFDKNACKTFLFLGILFAVVWFLAVTLDYALIMTEDEKAQFLGRLTGEYSFGIWLQPLFWLIITQLIRFNIIKKFLFFRILIVIPFVLTFERFVIIVTSLHRDYLPSSWIMYQDLEFT